MPMVFHASYRLFSVQLRRREKGRWAPQHFPKYRGLFIIWQLLFLIASHQIISSYLLCGNRDSSVHDGGDHTAEPKVARDLCRIPFASGSLVSDSVSFTDWLPTWGVRVSMSVLTSSGLPKVLFTWTPVRRLQSLESLLEGHKQWWQHETGRQNIGVFPCPAGEKKSS